MQLSPKALGCLNEDIKVVNKRDIFACFLPAVSICLVGTVLFWDNISPETSLIICSLIYFARSPTVVPAAAPRDASAAVVIAVGQ